MKTSKKRKKKSLGQHLSSALKYWTEGPVISSILIEGHRLNEKTGKMEQVKYTVEVRG